MKDEHVTVAREPFAVGRVLEEPSAVWDSNRKFREANVVASTITEHMSGLGMREYRVAMKALRSVATMFRHGEFDAFSGSPPGEFGSAASHDRVGEREPSTIETEVDYSATLTTREGDAVEMVPQTATGLCSGDDRPLSSGGHVPVQAQSGAVGHTVGSIGHTGGSVGHTVGSVG
ncbi:hypothetical protein F444_21184 [Phytophthora nicotianae P1976]|uniref:Uncharacterized protein n=1 Tax=Phytophthora nicotianae P1976 TaxID=1317066 RepID=A0A080Z1Y1_PHYNI|nr:hypothetical protein F444_21184 [Phytophthora nicotianae P1976]